MKKRLYKIEQGKKLDGVCGEMNLEKQKGFDKFIVKMVDLR